MKKILIALSVAFAACSSSADGYLSENNIDEPTPPQEEAYDYSAHIEYGKVYTHILYYGDKIETSRIRFTFLLVFRENGTANMVLHRGEYITEPTGDRWRTVEAVNETVEYFVKDDMIYLNPLAHELDKVLTIGKDGRFTTSRGYHYAPKIMDEIVNGEIISRNPVNVTHWLVWGDAYVLS